MSYVRRTVRAGEGTYIKEYYTGRHHPKGETRTKLHRTSSASVQDANRRKALDRLTWLLNENFVIGDYFVTLTYGKGKNKAVTWEQMQQDWSVFLRRLRYAYAKAGAELRFAMTPEVGPKGARHFHIVLPAIQADVIRKAWTHGFSSVKIVGPQTGKNVFDEIALYMMKASDKTRETLGTETIKRYTCSRNLREPKVRIDILLRDKYRRDKPFCPKGFYIVPDTVKEGVTEYGYAVLEYLCLRC